MTLTRRTMLGAIGATVAAPYLRAQTAKTVQTPFLNIGYEESGAGFPVILLHGFPDDVRAYDGVVPALVKAGAYLMSRQTKTVGDWTISSPQAEPGGWYFQFENELYPDVDDSAVVLMAAPVVVAAVLAAGDATARTFLVRSGVGLACLTAGLGLDLVAALWMVKITIGGAWLR